MGLPGSTSQGELFEGEQLILCRDDSVGLRAAISINDTTLGPAVGGIRLRRYPDDIAALTEVHRLAAGMTLKNAVAELPYGGAKAVIIQQGEKPTGAARTRLMRRFAEFVRRTADAYIPGVDMGTGVEDLALIGEAGCAVSCDECDPSPMTAVGVAHAVRAAIRHVDKRDDVEGVRVLIQGVGHVGAALAKDLAADGATVVVSDVDEARAEELAREVGGARVPSDAALEVSCDVFAPCAVARVVSVQTLARLDCRIIAGAANDTLADGSLADGLAARGITYVPDFVANAGGVIHIHAVREGWDDIALQGALHRIGDRVTEILEDAEATGATPLAVAERRARRIIEEAAAARTDGVRPSGQTDGVGPSGTQEPLAA